MSEAYRLGEILISQKMTLAAAESLTGGGFGYEITSHPGASNYFKGTLCTYVNDAKMTLGVKKSTLDEYGAVSSQTAEEMARMALEFYNSDVSISFTGNAGPSAMENKPVGLVYIGIDIQGQISVFSNIFTGDRAEIRRACIQFGIEMLEELLQKD